MKQCIEDVRISVLIPAFNAESTIQATLRSVLSQTLAPKEIVVMDDGSTDSTAALVKTFAPRVKLQRQANKGVFEARKALFQLAKGDLVAFLDHDDLWHPKYLEVQSRMFQNYPDAVVYFTAFENIRETQKWVPKQYSVFSKGHALIEPRQFLLRYNKASGFILPSFSVFRAAVLRKIGESLFSDLYLWYRLALLGPFVESHARLGAYRLVETSLSSDRIWAYKGRIKGMEQIIEVYTESAPRSMLKIAKRFLASSYRTYAKHLMGIGDVVGARHILRVGLRFSYSLRTLAVLMMTFLPSHLQPEWPGPRRAYRFDNRSS